MSESLWLYINGSSKVARLDKLHNILTPGYINDATVTMALVDVITGIAPLGQDFPVTLAYVVGSEGRYEAMLDYAIALTVGQRLTASCLAVYGALRHAWVQDALVVRG